MTSWNTGRGGTQDSQNPDTRGAHWRRLLCSLLSEIHAFSLVTSRSVLGHVGSPVYLPLPSVWSSPPSGLPKSPHPLLALVVNYLPTDAKNLTDESSIPESGRSLGGGHGNPLQYSCLENLMNRGAPTVHGVHLVTTKAT